MDVRAISAELAQGVGRRIADRSVLRTVYIKQCVNSFLGRPMCWSLLGLDHISKIDDCRIDQLLDGARALKSR